MQFVVMNMQYWLLKSEPSTFSIDDLKKSSQQITAWEGVRNYQARNFLKEMKLHDQAFFYHSSCKEPGIVGIVEVVTESYPDPTAFDAASPYYDETADPQKPRWFRVDVKFIRTLTRFISLEELKRCKQLKDLPLVKKGNRLSVMPIGVQQWKLILELEHKNEKI